MYEITNIASKKTETAKDAIEMKDLIVKVSEGTLPNLYAERIARNAYSYFRNPGNVLFGIGGIVIRRI